MVEEGALRPTPVVEEGALRPTPVVEEGALRPSRDPVTGIATSQDPTVARHPLERRTARPMDGPFACR
jgi:hypothetical protein